MRIRKRLQSLTTAPDLSSPPPQSTAAAAAVPVVATGAAGVKQGEVVAGGGGGEKLYGLGSGSGGGGAAGGGGRGLHPGMDLPAQTFHGCTTKPTSPPPSHPLPPDAAAPWGEERSDLAPRGSRFFDTVGVPPFDHAAREREVPKQEQEGENGGGGDGRRGRNTVVFIGATVAAPKSFLGAEALPVPPRGHGGYQGVAATASAKAEGMAGWAGGEPRGFPLKKRRGCCRARGTRSVCGDDDDEEEHGSEEKMVAAPADQMREVKAPRGAGNTRRRGVAASSYTTTNIGATAGSTSTARTCAFNGSSVGAPSSGSAAKKSDDVVPAKEEGAGVDVVSSATATALVGLSRGVGNGKKRRSPAVLMEGSRCSRVNGRGWRCCQQTLVGYSLCEHHLGKGRLRSVSSVRCNGRARKKEDVVDNGAAPSHLQPSPLQAQQQQYSSMSTGDVVEYYDVDEEEKPGKRRRKKIGMVKARSISSLLHLPNYSTPTAILAAAPAPEPCPSPSPVPAATGAVTACPATPAIV